MHASSTSTKHTHIGRRVRDRDRRLERIRLVTIIIPQLAKRRQTTVEPQRRIGSQLRRTAVRGNGEDVFFAPVAQGFDGLGGNTVGFRAGREGELERGECVGIFERSRVVGATTDDETAELVSVQVVLGLSDGVVEIQRRLFNVNANVKAGREDEGCCTSAEGGRDGPQRQSTAEEGKSEQETEGHASSLLISSSSILFMSASQSHVSLVDYILMY